MARSFVVEVLPGENYKLKVEGGPYSAQWYSGATGFVDATANAAPLTANFSMS